MQSIDRVGPAFVEMAHQIVWATAATVDRKGRPRSRVLHPIWQWNGTTLGGWIATGPTPLKRAHLEHSPHISINYWTPNQDTCVAECHAQWHFDLETRERIWSLFKDSPAPVGYDPAMIPGWESPSDDAFGALELTPWRVRVFPGSVLMGQGGEVLTWQSSDG